MAESPRPKSNLFLRLATAAVAAPLLLWLLYLGPAWGFPAVTTLVCLLGAWELSAMASPQHLGVRLWNLVATLGVISATALPAAAAHFPLLLMALVCGGMLANLARPEPMEGAAARLAWSIAGPLYLGTLFGALILLFRRDHGGSWVVLALLFSFISDTAGYFVGRAIGKRKLSPVVSPKKTIEGSLGGLAGGVLSGLLAHFWFLPVLPLLHAVLLALVATALGQAGDLCESLIKRSVGIKDSGNILPGHGGILDRSDAMLFCGAAVWAYVSFFAS
ncbi:MAG: phosphatidate cytidylyltransferase [Myxococcales bacterium]|nr:phosphatidate cytidylyltransferase [Myxococcales bacterium]